MLNVVKLHKDAIIPQKAHDGDAGFDLFALQDTFILPNDTKVIPTGIGIEIPYGYYGDVTGKSGLTSKTQLRVQRGIVDFGYRGDIGVIVSNQQSYKWDDNLYDMLLDARYYVDSAKELSDLFVTKILENEESGIIKIKKGQKIAQILISPCDPDSSVVVHSDFSKTSDRGEGGFGSTGIYQTSNDDHIPPCNPDDGRAQIKSFINLQANGFIGG